MFPVFRSRQDVRSIKTFFTQTEYPSRNLRNICNNNAAPTSNTKASASSVTLITLRKRCRRFASRPAAALPKPRSGRCARPERWNQTKITDVSKAHQQSKAQDFLDRERAGPRRRGCREPGARGSRNSGKPGQSAHFPRHRQQNADQKRRTMRAFRA